MFFLYYLFFCLAMGFLARNTNIGFWGFFNLSLLLTPVTTLVVLTITAPRANAGRRS